MKRLRMILPAILIGMMILALPTAAKAYQVRVEAYDVYLRNGAGAANGAVLSSPIPYGTILEVTQEATAPNGNPWGYVYYSGSYGWVALKQCSTVYSNGYNIQVNAYDVYLRYGAGASYGAVFSNPVPYGTVLTVTQEAQAANGNYWGYVYYGGSYGWVALTQCKRLSSGTASTSAGGYELANHVNYNIQVSAPDGGLNLREGAGVEYNRLLNYMIPNGTVLHVFFEDVASNGNSWGFVKYDGIWGWVALSQAARVSSYADSTPNYYVEINSVDGGVNLRSGAGVEYGKLINHLIPNGTILQISQEGVASNGNYWGYTTYEGVTGWVTLREIIPVAW